MRRPPADPGRAGRRDRHLQADRGESVRRLERSRAGRGHRRAQRPGPRPGRLLLRARRRRRHGARRQHRARRASSPSASTSHGGRASAASTQPCRRRRPGAAAADALTPHGRSSDGGRSRGPSGSRWSARPTRSTARPAGWSTCPTRRSCVGELDPVEVLARDVDGPVVVDNDVNWAARAERGSTGAARLRLPLPRRGARLRRRQRRRGPAGHAPGSPARSPTSSPSARGRAIPFIDVFGELGLRRPPRPPIDVAAALRALDDAGPAGPGGARWGGGRRRRGRSSPSATRRSSCVGGPWGSHPALHRAVDVAVGRRPRRVELRPPRAGADPSLTGARTDAVARLRSTILRASP